jgi:hypothetical protein
MKIMLAKVAQSPPVAPYVCDGRLIPWEWDGLVLHLIEGGRGQVLIGVAA